MKFGKHDIRKDNIGSWPRQFRTGLLAIIFVGLLFVAYLFDYSSQINKKVRLIREEKTLKATLKQKQHVIANLPAYQEQTRQAEADLRLLIAKLPTKAEIPALIEEISNLGKANGLIFGKLEPKPEIAHDYYIESPIDIQVKGNYQQLANFVTQVAAMKRIVGIKQFELRTPDPTSIPLNPSLELDFTATTYRYAPESRAMKKNKSKRGKR